MLSRPVTGFIEVHAGDQPLAGAELSWIEYVDANRQRVHLNKAICESLGIELTASDANAACDCHRCLMGASSR